MDWSLRDKTVGKGNPYDTSDERSTAEEEKVPVKTGRLFEWELFGLCCQGGDIVVIIEEKGQEETEGEGNENPFDRKIPKIDKPASRDSRVECSGGGKAGEICASEISRNMCETSPEESCDRVGIVTNDFSNGWTEDRRLSELFE